MAKTYHLSVSVRGMLNWSPRESQRNLKWITKNDGTHYASVAEMRNDLMDELAKGHSKLPTGPCDNHDWTNGCQGHEVSA